MILDIISNPCKYLIGKSGTHYSKKFYKVVEGKIVLKNTKDPKEIEDVQ